MTSDNDTGPNHQTIPVVRGASYSEPYAFEDDNEEPLDITGWEIVGEVQRVGSNVVAAEFSFDRANDAEGTGQLTVVGMESLSVGSYSFFIRYTDADGKVGYSALGLFRVREEAP